MRHLTAELEKVDATLANTNAQIQEEAAVHETKLKHQEVANFLVESLKAEVARCGDQLGDVTAWKLLSAESSESGGSFSGDASADANADLEASLVAKREAEGERDKTKEVYKAAKDSQLKLTAELDAVTAKITEIENSDGGGGAAEVFETLRKSIVSKTAVVAELEELVGHTTQEQENLHRELKAVEQKMSLVRMKGGQDVARFQQLEAEEKEFTLEYDAAEKKLFKLTGGKVRYGGNQGIQDLADQLKEVAAANDNEGRLISDLHTKQVGALRCPLKVSHTLTCTGNTTGRIQRKPQGRVG